MNEITGWTKSSTSVGTIAYDAAGQMTQNDRYRYVYDGFGRLVALKDASGSPIATYGYNGLGFRIWEQPNGGGGGGKRFFCYDERWRIVATFDDTNATPTRRVIHHAAGAAGMGGSSYIDSVILEDANDDTADVNLETRYYPLQNWRADVVCVGKLSSGGFQLVEVVDYDTYGNALSRPAVSADFDHDGGVTGSDLSDFFTAHGNGDPEADADLSGGITNDDIGVFYAAWEAGIFGPSRGVGAYSGVIAGYAGYVRDRFAVGGDLYHVRHRVYDTRMGTWTKRDPLGYVDGMGLYGYCKSSAIALRDPIGTECVDVIRSNPRFIPSNDREMIACANLCAKPGVYGSNICVGGRVVVCVCEDKLRRIFTRQLGEHMIKCTEAQEIEISPMFDCGPSEQPLGPLIPPNIELNIPSSPAFKDFKVRSCHKAKALRNSRKCMADFNCLEELIFEPSGKTLAECIERQSAELAGVDCRIKYYEYACSNGRYPRRSDGSVMGDREYIDRCLRGERID